jgi:putative peptidoglycan lipid II flippase
VTSLGTAASRLLGLVRDMVTAALLGLGEGGVMDALVVAFRVSNLPRRIFGEGALAASLLPVFAAEERRDRRAAWQFVSVLLVLVTLGLTGLVLAGEVVCLAWWWLAASASAALLPGLLAVMLPYLVFVCLAAQVSTVLVGLLRFRAAALAPVVLNVCWLAAAWWIAPGLSTEPAAQAYVIAVAIVVSGLVQVAVQLPSLRAAGFRFDFNWPAARPAVRQVAASMLPIALGLAVTQLNTLVDSFVAIGLAAEPGGPRTIGWLGGAVRYPLETGAAAAVYYGERFYQLPVGLLGVAIATVTYPMLARHAARGDSASVGADLTLALRLVWFLALPAGVGMMLVAGPATRVLFERGAFSADDAARAAAMIACYAGAVWAYCALPVLVRAYYAVGNRTTPARLGIVAVAINLVLTLSLIWPLAERGLAISTAVAAGVQAVSLAVVFSRTGSQLAWRPLLTTLVKGAAATIVMALAVIAIEHFVPVGTSRGELAAKLVLAIGTGAIVYIAAARLLSMSELTILLRRARSKQNPD